MTDDIPYVAAPLPAPRRQITRSSSHPSIAALEERLARAEGELRVQFTRIAQLQAELDRVLAAVRGLANGANVSGGGRVREAAPVGNSTSLGAEKRRVERVTTLV